MHCISQQKTAIEWMLSLIHFTTEYQIVCKTIAYIINEEFISWIKAEVKKQWNNNTYVYNS